MKWFPFFKTGKHTSSTGQAFDATSESLDKIIDMNKSREVPIAIGHPTTSSPAWGWVNELKRVGDTLYAKPKQLVAEFEAMVNKGMFKNISVSLNPDLTIRHIGFLGATPPAIPGLVAEFSESNDAVQVEFSMSEASALQDVGSIMQRLRDWFIEKFGTDTADKIVAQWQIDNLKTTRPDDSPTPASFSKPEGGNDMAKTIQELEADLAEEKKKVAEFSKTSEKVTQLEIDLAAERKKNQTSEFSAFLSSDELKDKVTPAIKQTCLDLMQCLSGTETYEFSAADGKTEKKSPLDVFKGLLKILPKAVEFSEQATKDKAAGATLDMTNAQDIAAKAIEFQRSQADKGVTISVTEAVAHVTTKK